MRTGVRLLSTVGAGVLGQTRSYAETLATDPAAERSQTAVDSLMVLQMGQLAEALSTGGALVEEHKRNGGRSVKYTITVPVQ